MELGKSSAETLEPNAKITGDAGRLHRTGLSGRWTQPTLYSPHTKLANAIWSKVKVKVSL
jgi:hypothetical protein